MSEMASNVAEVTAWLQACEHYEAGPCCLGRLIGVFEAAGDAERAGWYRRRRELLALTGESSSA